ncbi:MAG: sucrose-specific PTS transporter subunit IIBC [Micropruina sp.]|nr:PTS transporter subunit EIIC [Micropruina sp.]
MDHAQVARTVLAAVGGPDNISAAAHCATRLRLVLNDQEKVDNAALDASTDVKGTFLAGGLFQIIIGPGDVDVVFKNLISQGVRELSKDEAKQEAAKNDNIVVRFIKTISDIFVPILPALIAGGLMMAINNVLTAAGLFGVKSLVEMVPAIADYASMINLISSAAFAFLPVLVGFSAVKRFGGNVYLGAAMGAAMVSSSLANAWSATELAAAGKIEYWNVFGLQVAQIGYQAQVIPVLAVSWLLCFIEKRFHKWLKGTADFLLTPLLTMLITGFLAFVVVGPITRIFADGITNGLQFIYTSAGPLGGLIFGLLYSPIVVTGLHQSFPAVELPLINSGAGSFIFPIASVANVAQGAATLAVLLKARDAKLKGMAGASAASALFGITEPAIFGVNLRLRWPFFIAVGSAGVAAALIAWFNVRAIALGAAGLLGFVSIRTTDIVNYLIAIAVSFALSFGITYFYATTRGKESLAGAKVDDEADASAPKMVATPADALPAGAVTDFAITAIANGTLLPLAEVKDPTFAKGYLGPGVAILPTDGPVVSPVDGEIMVAFPTHHAYGIRTASGVEVLIHIGMDTVQLNGEHFTSKVKVGQVIRRGDVLATVDWAAVAAAGYDLTTPVVVTNAAEFGELEMAPAGPVTPGRPMFSVNAKKVSQPA